MSYSAGGGGASAGSAGGSVASAGGGGGFSDNESNFSSAGSVHTRGSGRAGGGSASGTFEDFDDEELGNIDLDYHKT